MSRLADLARAGLTYASPRTLSLDLEVHHIKDRPGYLFGVLEGPRAQRVPSDLDFVDAEASMDESGRFEEALSAGSYGIGVNVATRPRTGLWISSETTGLSVRPLQLASVEQGNRIFRGTANPNPTFLYESNELLEGLVVIDNGSRVPSLAQGRVLRRVLSAISVVATENLGAPILALHSPAQVPKRMHAEQHSSLGVDEWTESSAIAVRFAIATGEITASDRASGLGPLISLCRDLGLGLELSDSRPGHRSGNWFTLTKAVQVDESPRTADQICYAGYPITLVGPARIGSTWAVMECLNEVDDLPILCCSAASLDDLAFISFTVGVSKDRYAELRPRGEVDKTRDLDQLRAVEAIPMVLSALGYRRLLSDAAMAKLLEKAGDYSCCHGPLIRTKAVSLSPSRPIWFSLDIADSSQILHRALAEMYVACADVLGPAVDTIGSRKLRDGRPVVVPNLEYLVARAMANGRLRARGKFAIPDPVLEALYPGRSFEDRAALIAPALGDRWSERLNAAIRSVGQTSVAWRENWLGHWVSRL